MRLKLTKLTPEEEALKEIDDVGRSMFDLKKRMMLDVAQMDYYRARLQYLKDVYTGGLSDKPDNVIQLGA